MTRSREELVRRHEALRARLERLLYDYDPEGMGSTVSAPLDEYSGTAIRLIRALRDRDAESSLSETVWDVVPTATVELVREIDDAWRDSQSD